ncbi:MAG: prolyl oligopeptidase family serine peptidase [Bacteroidales bacterium]|nr:prolyl oligopeptidase family serine peptidase [Bacteroidales bacterium]
MNTTYADKIFCFCSILFIFFTLPLMAQKKQFTIEDLIPGGSTYYAHSVPENKYLTWWGEECVELGEEECRVINKQDVSAKTLLTAKQVNDILSATDAKPLRHFYYASFPKTGEPLVWVAAGNEFTLINWEEKKIVNRVVLHQSAEGVDWDKSSQRVAYTVNHNLFVTASDGDTHQVTTDGNNGLRYGESVHRNEFGIEKGTFWSPDGSLLAFYRMDQSMVSFYPQVNITPYGETSELDKTNEGKGESRCAQLAPDAYPMAGETSHKVAVGIYNPVSKKTIYLNTGDPTDRYFTNIAWSPDGKSLFLIELNRDQNHGSLDEYDATTGEKLRTLLTESNDKYFEPLHPIQFLPWNKKQFIYQTRKDGYNHLYLYDINGKQIRQLTKGTFEVIDFVGFNEARKEVLYTSNEAHALQNNLYSVTMDGKRTLLGNHTGWHSATLSPTGRFIIDQYSSPELSRCIDIIDTQSKKTRNVLNADNPWADYDVPEIKVGTLKAADGVTDLYYRLILPTHFDPTKKYPAVVYVYGGPHAHNIDATPHWGARGWDIWMAQQGYIMFCVDNRGSEHRGLAFEQATFRQLGVEEMKDQVKGVDYLKSLSYVDGERIGVHGWSFGGFMTSSLMTTYPDVFKVGVAGGPVIDWRFYEVMYGERYMDTPQTNPEGYANTSLLGKAQNLKGRLMVIYGDNDPVCVPQHTLSFIRACIDAGTYPDLFTYPGDGHNMMGTDRVHLHHVITRYFEDHLK